MNASMSAKLPSSFAKDNIQIYSPTAEAAYRMYGTKPSTMMRMSVTLSLNEALGCKLPADSSSNAEDVSELDSHVEPGQSDFEENSSKLFTILEDIGHHLSEIKGLIDETLMAEEEGHEGKGKRISFEEGLPAAQQRKYPMGRLSGQQRRLVELQVACHRRFRKQSSSASR